MTRYILVALASSGHDGSVRSAGGGIIPSRRWPRPSPLAPWQIAQLAAKMIRPASSASRDDNNPVGIVGELPSHPEMMSKIARMLPIFSLGFGKHLVSKTLDLSHDSFNKFVKLPLDRT